MKKLFISSVVFLLGCASAPMSIQTPGPETNIQSVEAGKSRLIFYSPSLTPAFYNVLGPQTVKFEIYAKKDAGTCVKPGLFGAGAEASEKLNDVFKGSNEKSVVISQGEKLVHINYFFNGGAGGVNMSCQADINVSFVSGETYKIIYENLAYNTCDVKVFQVFHDRAGKEIIKVPWVKC